MRNRFLIIGIPLNLIGINYCIQSSITENILNYYKKMRMLLKRVIKCPFEDGYYVEEVPSDS